MRRGCARPCVPLRDLSVSLTVSIYFCVAMFALLLCSCRRVRIAVFASLCSCRSRTLVPLVMNRRGRSRRSRRRRGVP